MSVKEAKKAQGYRPRVKHDECGNCANVGTVVVTMLDASRTKKHRCFLGDFSVGTGGKCDEWKGVAKVTRASE